MSDEEKPITAVQLRAFAASIEPGSIAERLLCRAARAMEDTLQAADAIAERWAHVEALMAERDALRGLVAALDAYAATDGRPRAERIEARKRVDEARAAVARMEGGR